MPACELKPKDKTAFLSAVGEDLVQKHGKRKYYKNEDIGRSVIARGFPMDYSCWAYCIFSSPEDFKSLHDAAGEVCDYVSMKAEVLSELAGAGGFSWFDIDLSWLEWPDIDLSGLFDWFDFTP